MFKFCKCPWYKINVRKQKRQCSTILNHIFWKYTLQSVWWTEIHGDKLMLFSPWGNSDSRISLRSHIYKEGVGDHHAKRWDNNFLFNENWQGGRLEMFRNKRKHGQNVGEANRKTLFHSKDRKKCKAHFIIKLRRAGWLYCSDSRICFKNCWVLTLMKI